MAVNFNGSSQYLTAASSLLSDETICMIGWGKPVNITAQMTVVSLGEKSASGFWSLEFSGATASDPIRALKDNTASTGVVAASSSSGFTANWHLGAANFSSNTSRDAFLDGANKGSNATSRTDSTPNLIEIGRRALLTPANYFNGDIADVYILDMIPSDAQHALFGKGIHPLDAGIPFVNIRGWYTLMGSYQNSMAGGFPGLSAVGSPSFSADSGKNIPPQIGALQTF